VAMSTEAGYCTEVKIVIIICLMELGHLLTRSGLTYPEVPSKVCHDSFFQLGNSVSLAWVIYYEAFYLRVVSIFSCIPVICPKLVLFLIPLQFICFVICPSYVIATRNINKTGSVRVSNIEERSRNHCSRRRAMRMKCRECVRIYPLFIRHAVRMRLFISSSLVCLALLYFTTLSHKW
jgi:hypothetical protein